MVTKTYTLEQIFACLKGAPRLEVSVQWTLDFNYDMSQNTVCIPSLSHPLNVSEGM